MDCSLQWRGDIFNLNLYIQFWSKYWQQKYLVLGSSCFEQLFLSMTPCWEKNTTAECGCVICFKTFLYFSKDGFWHFSKEGWASPQGGGPAPWKRHLTPLLRERERVFDGKRLYSLWSEMPCIDDSSATGSPDHPDKFLSSNQKRSLVGELQPPMVQMWPSTDVAWGSFKPSWIESISYLSCLPTMLLSITHLYHKYD